MTNGHTGNLTRGEQVALGVAYGSSMLGVPTAGLGLVAGVLLAGTMVATNPSPVVRAHAKRILLKDGAMAACAAVLAVVLVQWIAYALPSGAELVWGALALAVSGLLVFALKVSFILDISRVIDGSP